MEELFRFNITRAIERSDASGLPLVVSNEDAVHTNTGPLVLPSPNDKAGWPKLESEALNFIVNTSPWLLSPGFQTFTEKLKSRLTDLQALPADKLAPSKWPADFRKAFEKLASQSDLKQWNVELSKLFLVLLIIRSGGSAHINSLIQEQNIPPNLIPILFDKPSLSELADLIRFIALLLTTAADLAKMTANDVQAALAKTLLVPSSIFSKTEKPVHAIGFADLYLVKQHIHHYELGEIARIENILKGESRNHSQKHFLSNERDTFIQTEKTTETDDELTTTDHVNMRNEVENTLKEDTKVDGGLHIQYDGAAYKVQTDLTAAYGQSSSESQKSATEIAKDVTQKTAKKVTQRIQQSETIKILETFEDDENQAFDNTKGQNHISGIYQWVEKVYLAQVFNYGRHLLFDIMVPEPAASLLAAATIPPKDQKLPVPPSPLKWISFPNTPLKPPRPLEVNDDIDKLIADGALIHDLTPEDLNPDEPDDSVGALYIDYTRWISQYQVTGGEPSPERFISVGKSFSRDKQEGQDIAVEDEVKIPDGYQALTATAGANWKHHAGEDEIGVVIVYVADTVVLQGVDKDPKYPSVAGIRTDNNSDGASDQYTYYVNRQFKDLTLDENHHPRAPIMGAAAISISGVTIEQVSVGIEIRCERMTSALRKWQLSAYESIVTAWQKLQSDYEDKMAAMQFQKATVGPLGAADPETNRQIERTELKRACIAILDNNNATVRGVNVAVQNWQASEGSQPDPTNPILPEPVLPNEFVSILTPPSVLVEAEELGARVRWFEQAFEWDKIGYIFYPYFWGRRSEWLKQLNLKNDDPLFQNFLQAGYARVVIPVRIGFEHAINFYLLTGQPWMGGELPKIGDKTQNPLYLSIVEEMKAQTGAPGNETPVGDPWYIRLPTALIKLRKDDERPTWVRVPKDITPPDNAWTWEEGASKP